MYYVYHGVPEHIKGTKLIPLNQMHQLYPDLRKKYLEKYKGREQILERRIPLLDCSWNDVVQFLPLHPQKVFQLQQELGIISKIPPYQFYEIAAGSLDPSKTVIFLKTAPGEENTVVKWLDDVDLATIQDIPYATIEYFESVVGTGGLPFNYQFIPHILYKGTLDISNTPIITL